MKAESYEPILWGSQYRSCNADSEQLCELRKGPPQSLSCCCLAC